MAKSKFPLTAAFFALALIVCTVVRYLQYYSVIKPDNGFFIYDGGFLVHAYYLLFAVFAAGLVGLAIVDGRAKRGILKNKPASVSGGRKLSEIQSVTGAVLSAVCGFFLALELVDALGKNSSLISLIAMSLAALGFTFVAYVIFTKRSLVPVTAIAFLFIAAYFVFEAAAEFMQRIYTVNLSARLIVLSVNLLLSLFFLTVGRITVRSEGRFTAILATIFGYSLVLLALSDAASRLLYYSYCHQDDRAVADALLTNNNGFTLPQPLFIAQAIMVLWFVFALSSKKREKKYEHEKVDENEEIEVNKEADS